MTLELIYIVLPLFCLENPSSQSNSLSKFLGRCNHLILSHLIVLNIIIDVFKKKVQGCHHPNYDELLLVSTTVFLEAWNMPRSHFPHLILLLIFHKHN